jgi:thiamine biosynthesis lipoprotein
MIATVEASETFPCFGSACSVHVTGGAEAEAVETAKRRLLSWHGRFTRFDPASELCRLNADPRAEVPVSRLMALFIRAVVRAAEMTGGLVDGTLLDQLERAGYERDLGASPPLPLALWWAPARRPARPSLDSRWREIELDLAAGVVRRPPGLRLDSGGVAKGLFADLLARELATHEAFAVDCAGDLRVGGAAGIVRPVRVAGPFDGRTLHTFELVDRGIATSGIGKRSWVDADAVPAHHLLDPATGRPAFTGVVQATALAPTALEAEARAKAAVLGGPEAARGWLPHGGAVVLDDGSHYVVEPRSQMPLSRLSLASNGARRRSHP